MISVLIPVHNGVEFLAASLSSALNQTYRDIEVIIGVNGHPAASETLTTVIKMVDLIRAEDRVRVLDFPSIHTKNDVLNEMVVLAKADRIALLDVDDFWHPYKLANQVAAAANYDVVATDAEYFGDRSGRPGVKHGVISFDDLLLNNHVINSSALLRRCDAWWDPNSNGIEDYDCWLRLAKLGRSIIVLPSVLTFHRVHSASAFNSKPHDVHGLRAVWRGKGGRTMPDDHAAKIGVVKDENNTIDNEWCPVSPAPVEQSNRPKRILVGLLSCELNQHRRARCEATWMRHQRCLVGPEFDLVFLVGGSSDVHREGNILHLPVPDDYASLPQKTRGFCNWALERSAHWDYLFKADDDTYVDLHKLTHFPLHDGMDYVGQRINNGYASGGAGYFLSCKAAQIVRDRLTTPTGDEDGLVGQSLSQHGILLHDTSLFHGFTSNHPERFPRPGNKTVTGHGMSAEFWDAHHTENVRIDNLVIWMPTSPRYRAVAEFSREMLSRHWPAHPPIEIDGGVVQMHWADQAIRWLSERKEDLVLLVLDDYAACMPVDAQAIRMSADLLRRDHDIASVALTWQTPADDAKVSSTHGRCWVCMPAYTWTVNLQAAIWRRVTLIEWLRFVPPAMSIWDIEQHLSHEINVRGWSKRQLSWACPRPANASGWVDTVTKDAWPLAYHNLCLKGRLDPRHEAWLQQKGVSHSMIG